MREPSWPNVQGNCIQRWTCLRLAMMLYMMRTSVGKPKSKQTCTRKAISIDRRRSSSMQQTAAQHTAHFINVMRIVSENASSTSRIGDFDLRATHDWVEVKIEAALISQEKYNDKTKGFKGFFPRIARKIGEMNPAIEPIATTLPAGDYTSLVCGGSVTASGRRFAC